MVLKIDQISVSLLLIIIQVLFYKMLAEMSVAGSLVANILLLHFEAA